MKILRTILPVQPSGTNRVAVVSGLVLACLLLGAPSPIAAGILEETARPVSSDAPDFQTDILPIFQRHCLRCHDSQKQMGGLDLSTLSGISEGSGSGRIVVLGKPQESRLFEVLEDGSMPLDRQTVPSLEEVATIRSWIESSLPSPDAASTPEQGGIPLQVTEREIVPLMLLHCTSCHGRHLQEGGLDLRTRASMLKGGKSGPALVPGDPEKSLIVRRIRSQEMPPLGREVEAGVRRMGDRDLERLVQWIALGSPTAEADSGEKPDVPMSDRDRQFWSFRPPRQVPIPKVKQVLRVRNPVDAFILSQLEEKGLTLSTEADRLTLIRRASFDLTGLPPEPEEVERFLADRSDGAYEALIDRLLSSPRYGERWARSWLDLAGYSDRPHAYRYRDYVIRSFNADKPYDRFLLEQLAGDELVNLEKEPVVTPEIMDNLVATGFLRMAPDKTGNRLTNFVPHRLQVISDQIEIFTTGVMALTVGCARCHDHKFDPIPQRDYYRLAALFKGAFDEHDWLPPDLSEDPERPVLVKEARYLPYVTPMANPLQLDQERLRREAENEKWQKQIDRLQAALEEKAKPLRKKLIDQRLAKLPRVLHEDLRQMLETPRDKRTELQNYLASKFEQGLKIRFGDLGEFDEDYGREAARTGRQVKLLQANIQPEPQIRALWDRGAPSPTYILRRGEPMSPGRWVTPGVPSVLTNGRTKLQIDPPWPGAKKTGRRLALARWLTEADHPLTARVMVNRIWKHHFGRGMVETMGNFGRQGARPTHPELLDWLAREFVRRNWSMKAMHRLIMTSNTYRQASTVTPSHRESDPENRLWSRMPLRRMEAETLRDTLFLVAGRLDEKRYGRPDLVLQREDGLATSVGSDSGWRRSIYVTQQTSYRMGQVNPTILESFDFPEMTPNCLERVESTVVPQALHLLNDSTIRQLADALASRVRSEAGHDLQRQMNRAYWITLSRPPTPQEREVGLQALTRLNRLAAQQSIPSEGVSQQGLAKFCHTLLNSAGFIYID